jgi:hypothetical protein
MGNVDVPFICLCPRTDLSVNCTFELLSMIYIRWSNIHNCSIFTYCAFFRSFICFINTMYFISFNCSWQNLWTSIKYCVHGCCVNIYEWHLLTEEMPMYWRYFCLIKQKQLFIFTLNAQWEVTFVDKMYIGLV